MYQSAKSFQVNSRNFSAAYENSYFSRCFVTSAINKLNFTIIHLSAKTGCRLSAVGCRLTIYRLMFQSLLEKLRKPGIFSSESLTSLPGEVPITSERRTAY